MPLRRHASGCRCACRTTAAASLPGAPAHAYLPGGLNPPPVAGPDAHDVADAEHADDVAVVGDDEVPEPSGDHRLGGLVDRPVRGGGHEAVRDVRGDAFDVGVEP